jgi:hypothetical protein
LTANNLDEAIASLQSTLRLAPKFSQVRNYLTRAYLLKCGYETALEISQQAPFEYFRLLGQALVPASRGARSVA